MSTLAFPASRSVPIAPPRPSSALLATEAGAGRSTLADLLRLMGVIDSLDDGADVQPLLLRALRPGEVLFHEGGAMDAVYFVRGGTFKRVRTCEDGYEQVLDFADRGDLLGLDALGQESHPSGAVALELASVYCVPVHELHALGHRYPSFDRILHQAAARALAARDELASMMAAVAAEVRLARFLLLRSQRLAASGQSPRRFRLRMGRRDIASHLGVAHETVSRSFGALAGMGVLRVDNREVEIIDMAGLRELARSTRRPQHDGDGLRAA